MAEICGAIPVPGIDDVLLFPWKPAPEDGNYIALTTGEDFVNRLNNQPLTETSSIVHATCQGGVDFRLTNKETRTFICRRCALRIEVPSSVATIGDLRKVWTP